MYVLQNRVFPRRRPRKIARFCYLASFWRNSQGVASGLCAQSFRNQFHTSLQLLKNLRKISAAGSRHVYPENSWKQKIRAASGSGQADAQKSEGAYSDKSWVQTFPPRILEGRQRRIFKFCACGLLNPFSYQNRTPINEKPPFVFTRYGASQDCSVIAAYAASCWITHGAIL